MVDSKSLRDHRFFKDMTEEELAVVSKITQKKDFKLGQTIFKASDAGHSLFLIRSGEVKACVAAPDGEVFTLTILREGDIFGQMSFADATSRSATITTISDVKTFVIEGSDFETIVDANPRIVQKVMKNIILAAHAIVRNMNSRYIEMINYMWGRKRFT